MLDFNPLTVIAVIVHLVLLFWILRRLLLKPVSEFLEKRRQMIHDDLDNAKRDKEEAYRLLEEHRQMLARGKEDAAKIVEEAVRQADLRREELMAQAEQEGAAVIERAKLEIKREQAKAIAQLRSEIAALSVAVAEKMLARSVTDLDQDQIFHEVLEELDESYAKYGS